MWKLKEHNIETESKIKEGDTHLLVARLLAQSSVDAEKVDEFLSTDYKDLNDPFLLNDVEKGAKIFLKHAKAKSRVAIIGDYDCDGITSTTMLYELCRGFNLHCTPFLPSRLDHGYGLNELTIAAFKKRVQTPPQLLIVTDCGTSNRKEIEQLKEFGIEDIIIIDHHLPYNDESLVSHNADALISWHLSGDFNEMCACGEVYQFIRGIRKFTNHVDPIEFLSYAAIGTIADSQPIVGDNRIIVKNGLTKFAFDHVLSSGLNSLIKAKMKYASEITQTDIGFRIAPMINAAGRIEIPDIVLRLLIQEDPTLADEMAVKVIELNEQRKHLQTFVEVDASAKAKESKFENGVFVYGENYHIGIVGIVASRVVEDTCKPSLVIGFHNGVWKGSGRSVPGVNLKEILDTCSFMFEKYGGHAAAVGVTVKEEYLERAPEIFDKACKDYYEKHTVSNELVKFYNASLKIKAVNEEIAKILKEKLSPYCKDHNTEPIFKLTDVKVTSVDIREGKGWRVMTFSAYKGEELLDPKMKWFSPKLGKELEGASVDVYFQFPQSWDNSKRFEKFDLTVVDVVKRT
jgi:single-stranded-DNA-specific exonuclease